MSETERTCSGCRNPFDEPHKRKTCDACCARAAINREKRRKTLIKCAGKIMSGPNKGKPCTSKVSPVYKNKYCENHGKQLDDGKRRCKSTTKCPNVLKGKAELPADSEYETCKGCRDIASQNDREKRQVIIYENQNNADGDTRICYNCAKNNNIHDKDDMGVSSSGNISNLCKLHFYKQQLIESKRHRNIDERREYYKRYDAKPHRKESRRQYRKDNPGKIYKYYTTYRARQLNENPEAYRKKNAENHREWAKKNPELVKRFRMVYRTNIDPLYKVYIGRAKYSNLAFELDQYLFAELVTDKCYYCDATDEQYLGGIDRLDSAIGYIENNVVHVVQHAT